MEPYLWSSKILQSLLDSARLLSTAHHWVYPYVLLLEICHKTKTICLTCQTALTCWGMDRGPHWVLRCSVILQF